MTIRQREKPFVFTQDWEMRRNTFCSSWDPEYFAEMDLISPPNAEAHSLTLKKRRGKKDTSDKCRLRNVKTNTQKCKRLTVKNRNISVIGQT